MTLLLALDTSGPAVTAALHDGVRVVAAAHHHDARRHAELLAATVSEVLAAQARVPAELTGVVVGVGPGPFTGLRVGVVTARVLGAALGVPVSGVCSLDALAEAAPAGLGAFLVATDARRHEVHWARYRRDGDGHPVRADGPCVARPADVPTGGLPVVGRGALLYPGQLGEPPAGAPLDVDAAALARLGVRASGVLLPPEPLYLCRPDAAEPGARKRVLR
ncbi:MAG TPA: tRNA (adenosine(37)-N6)-threonylcarbamoyltransferase complex dimerization subunit type 1 TsaB [Kineosporiaceae bacterium]